MTRTARQVRQGLSHPVVDSDAHLLEPASVLYDHLTDLAGAATARRLLVRAVKEVSMGDRDRGVGRVGWWATPADAKDLASVMAPRLLYERLDELGIDFCIVYPSAGLAMMSLPEDEFRQLGIRAVNTMNAGLCLGLGDRLIPGALIPMVTPEEAVRELRYIRGQLGVKVAAIAPFVARPVVNFRESFPVACHLDSYGLDSQFDYDPVWATFQELGLAVNSHGALVNHLPFGARSPTNFVFNHINAHAFQQEHFCKSIVLGGVPQRFPRLNFAFLECGVLWGCELLQALLEHWHKRGPEGLHHLDPARTDRKALQALLLRYGGDRVADSIPFKTGRPQDDHDVDLDEFDRAVIRGPEDIVAPFEQRFFFGCESDDRGLAHAMAKPSPYPCPLQPFFSSDIGHWDVSDVTTVLPESHRLRDEGFLDEDQYERFTFRHAVLLHGGMDRGFFDATVVEASARAVLEADDRSRGGGPNPLATPEPGSGGEAAPKPPAPQLECSS